MNVFNYLTPSNRYAPWQTTFDKTSFSAQAAPGGYKIWFGQNTDGNSIWLNSIGGVIVSLTINDGLNDLVTATLNLPDATFASMLAGGAFTNADLVAFIMSGDDVVNGNRGNNRLWGGAGNDSILGGDGNDLMAGGLGDDTIDGGIGTNTANYAESLTGVAANLATGIADGEGHDQLISIQNLTGSAYSDKLTGDAAANMLSGGGGDDVLIGGGGNDSLSGGLGNDVLSGGAGDDLLVGGAGTDTVGYRDAAAAVTVDLSLGKATGDGTDTLSSIENVTGSRFADVLIGNAGANVLSGGAGDDQLDGLGGNDVLAGGLGNDTINGGSGRDTVSYALSATAVTVNLAQGTATGEGNDTLIGIENVEGSQQGDRITGNRGANVIDGQAGNDILLGGGGDDRLIGSWGDDRINGGAGFDTADYSGSAAGVTVNLTLGTAAGEGSDTLTSIEAVTGSADVDVLIGGVEGNRLDGSAGDDIIDGMGGNDTVIGGEGADTFHFTAGFGNDTVADFASGLDHIQFEAGLFIDGNDVLAHAVDTAAGVVISYDALNTVTLSGVTLAALHASDFI